MKKNRVFWSMVGLSVALHGLALIGMPGDGFHTPPPDQGDTIVSTLTMVKVGTPPPVNAPDNPREQPVIEKKVEPLPKVPQVQETTEEVREDDETHERDTGDTEEARESAGTQEGGNDSGNHEALPGDTDGESGTITGREYEELLTYIKEFIGKNLIYPPMARRRNIEGIVGVSFEIESTGGFEAVTVAHSSGSSILDNAAVSLIKKIPPLKNLTINRALALNVNIAYELTE